MKMVMTNISSIKKNSILRYHSIFSECHLFHTSACLYVSADDRLRDDNLKDDNVTVDRFRELSEEALKADLINSDLKTGLDEFKAAIKEYNNTPLEKQEVQEVFEDVQTYIGASSDNGESFEDTMAKYWVTKADIQAKEALKELKALEASSKETIDYESHITISTDILATNLTLCKERGLECTNIINVTEFLKESKILVEKSSGDKENIITLLTHLFNEYVEKVGSTTIKEVATITMDKAENIKKYSENINFSVNQWQSLLNIVSYSLMLRTYNKLIYDRPLPAGLSNERVARVRYYRYLTRALFASRSARPRALVLPATMVGISYFKTPLIGNVFKLLPVPQPSQLIENRAINDNAIFFFTFLKKSKWKLVLLLIFIFIFLFICRVALDFDVGNVTSFFNIALVTFETYWRIIIFTTIWVIILLHALGLLLLWWAERKYVTWSDASYSPTISWKFYHVTVATLISICSNKDELNYYKGYLRAVIIFFFIYFIVVLILTSVTIQINWN